MGSPVCPDHVLVRLPRGKEKHSQDFTIEEWLVPLEVGLRRECPRNHDR